MRKKIFNVLNKIYGILMTASFFAGFLPLIPFVIAMIIGGPAAEAISVFLQKQYYPWVIICGSVAVVVGLIAMYIGKLESFSVKSITANTANEEEETEEEQ